MAATALHNAAVAMEAARFLHAFVECNRQTQENVLEMVSIVLDPSSTDDERSVAGDAIIESLYPMMAADIPEDDRQVVKDNGDIARAIEVEERAFADNVRTLMAQHGITQEVLAHRAGIGQPAVSNILTRRCRPQRRTIVKFAEALGVSPEDLWPGFSATATG